MCELSNFINIQRPGSWDEAKQYFEKFRRVYAFRGQSKSEWSLRTSLERVLTNVPRHDAEQAALHTFKKRAYQYHSYIPVEKDLEWLAVMQHYGAPTRLLDWTQFFPTAVYFAVEGASDPEGSSAVWAIDVKWCAENAFQKMGERPKGQALLSNDDYFRRFLANQYALVAPVQSRFENLRLSAQGGLFLCVGNTDLSFGENLISGNDQPVKNVIHKLIIPNGWRSEILRDLRRNNTRRDRLFPDEDGLGGSLRDNLGIVNDIDHNDRDTVEAVYYELFDYWSPS